MLSRVRLSRWVGALLLVLPAGAAPLHAQGSDLFQEGLERYRAGDYVEAQRLLREYVEAFGERGGREAAHLGEAYHYLGLMTPDANLAEGYFLAVAQRYPAAPVADESVARLGHLYLVLGNPAEARKQWQALSRDYPLSRYVPEADLRIGETHFAERDWERAYSAFSAGFAKMKGFQRAGGQGANLRDLEGEYVYWIGRTLLARGAAGDARKYLNLVLLDYPNHPLEPLALYHLAESYRAEGKEREAQDAWRRFGEAVRNRSLEPIAEDPNRLALARVAERDALERRGVAAPGAAPAPQAPAAETRGEPGAEAGVARDPGGGRRAAGGREDSDPDVEAQTGLGAPAEDQGLRAPEPGRAGGVVPDEPVGRRVAPEPEEPGPADREAAESLPDEAGDGEPGELPEPQPAPREPAALGPERPPRQEAVVERAPIEEAAPEQPVYAGRPGAAEPGEPVPEVAYEPMAAGLYYLQVGAFTSATTAAKLSESLRRKGLEPTLQSGLVNGQGYYRVRFGPYEVPRDRSVLEATRADLQKAGFSPILARAEETE